MRTLKEIEQFLDALNDGIAADLEGQDLAFQHWDNTHSRADCVKLVVKVAISMANGGGGTVVFGVADQVAGRESALIGVPCTVDTHRLKKSVYDNTEPKITPVFEELRIPEGTGRLLVMQIYPGIPPYTDLSGGGNVRVGKGRRPLTGSFRQRLVVEAGECDYTAEIVHGTPGALLSPSALEQLRYLAAKEKAPADLLQLQDIDFLAALGLLCQGKLTRAALLLAGTERAICEQVPNYSWTFLSMRSCTQYSRRDCKSQSLPKAIIRLEKHIAKCNAIDTVTYGGLCFGSRVYPEKALREILLNAFCHMDYHAKSPIMVKVYQDRIEVDNPGRFMAGVTPQNILHHQPAPRNSLLVDALVRLRLVNRSNLGMSRIFEAFLIEGKEVPTINEVGKSVRVTMRTSSLYPEFCAFIADYAEKGRLFSVDELLVFHYLFSHLELTIQDASFLSQREEKHAGDILEKLSSEGFLEKVNSGHGVYWFLQPDIYQAITGAQYPGCESKIERKSSDGCGRSVANGQVPPKDPGLNNNEYSTASFN